MLNRYAHGSVAVHLILACKEERFFQLLKKKATNVGATIPTTWSE